MQNQAAPLKPEQIIDIITRRRWIIIIPICIFMTLGFLYTLTIPLVFEASTTILIQPQRVPSSYVQSIVSTDVQQRINTISQQILSRTNLERIISEFNLYAGEDGMYQEDMIEDMRKNIEVTQNSRMRSGTEAFSVAFKWNDPQVVMNVANKLASLFMDENLKAREVQAMGTSEFLDSELLKIKKTLEEREETLAAYRAKYMGGLPDELETNLRTLDRLQVQYMDALTALRETQNAATVIKNQISLLREASQRDAAVQVDGTVIERPVLSPLEQQYENGKRQLDELLLRYTEKHPEVLKLTQSVNTLKGKLDEEIKETAGDESMEGDSETREFSPNANLIRQQEFNLRQVENQIKNLNANIQQIRNSMQVHQQRVEDTPKREQELQSIQRDYSNIRESYNSLLARKLEAEIAVNMEKKQKGEQFRIIDYARLPEKPVSPDVRKLLLFSFAVSLGIGGGIIFLLEFLNPAIRSENVIEEQIGLPVLVSIPPVMMPGMIIKKRIGYMFFGIASMYAFLILSMFAILHIKGITASLNFIKKYINF